ncbi:MAG: RidA family protein [Gemmatimonadetes bacterium]|nr:RidA family protein [Gemmatimonadota bacterium]MBT6143938.1 RidA family protein [Gemmatimonadota bacterium]MBT7863757.1 RidA family protein [Gemmatimonadota bacterium]
MTDLPAAWQRDFDVYDRIKELGIDLKSKEDIIPAPSGRRICMITLTPSGLVFTSGTGGGRGAVTNDDNDVEEGYEAGRDAGINHLRVLHWGLHPEGTLNDIWYCVKCIGMVNSAGGGAFSKSPRVVDGYSKIFHDVFGGPLSQFAEDGADASYSGWHARSAVAGFDLPGHVRIEPEMIVQIDPALATSIIRTRGPHA